MPVGFLPQCAARRGPVEPGHQLSDGCGRMRAKDVVHIQTYFGGECFRFGMSFVLALCVPYHICYYFCGLLHVSYCDEGCEIKYMFNCFAVCFK